MDVLIIEDEQFASQRLIRLLSEITSEIVILKVIESVEKAINWFHVNKQPDLILMDIQLEDGLSFEIFENSDIKSPIIFTTAYDKYTLKAFKVNSVDYLLKPIKLSELKIALDKFKKLHYHNSNVKIENALSQLLPKKKERFLIKIGEHYKSIEVSLINCFYIKERCNFINSSGGKNYPIDYSLDKIESMVDDKVFFRINRNMIVNFSSIEDILAYSSNRLKLTLKDWAETEYILVSRERVGDFKNWMDR